jgi:cytoskeletal protein RodZ
MGRWTPLILMAGGLAILLGTLLGINFPMGGQQSAKVPPSRRAASVLPANINVNSTASREESGTANKNESASANSEESPMKGRSKVAQNNASTEPTTNTENTQETNTTETSATETQSASTENTSTDNNSDKEPIRALW